MSRGPGRWQRGILAALEIFNAIHLMALLPRRHSRAQVVALNRAARQLAAAGKVQLKYAEEAHLGVAVVVRPDFNFRSVADAVQSEVTGTDRHEMYGVSFDVERRRRVWIDRMGNRHYQRPLNQTPPGQQDKCCTPDIMPHVQHLEA